MPDAKHAYMLILTSIPIFTPSFSLLLDCWPDMPDLSPPGEFGRHTISLRSIIATLNARCFHSVSGGVSV